MKKTERLYIRVSPAQFQVLTELKDALHTSYSMIVRAFIQDFLTKNQDALEDLINKKLDSHGQDAIQTNRTSKNRISLD